MHVYDSRGYIPQGALLAGAFFALLSLFGIAVAPTLFEHETSMEIHTTTQRARVGDNVNVQIVVAAKTPINVFKGELLFDPEYFEVADISYNTSIADLWAELPWYSNGAGTLNFAGGATHTGGFTGEGSLITITFRAKQVGYTTLHLRDVRILKHDGLGTDTSVMAPIDVLFTVDEDTLEKSSVSIQDPEPTKISVTNGTPHTDLNGDGVQSIADVSMFIRTMFRGDVRYDFNGDGHVDTADLGIIMNAR